MMLKCAIGIHTWDHCICVKCKAVRKKEHSWLEDCETCSKCGKSAREIIDSCPKCGNKYSPWVAHPYCQSCKTFIFHDLSQNCETCAKCGKGSHVPHNWSRDCEKCTICGITRENSHNWVKCKCTKCGIVRNENHDWSENCERCSVCKTFRKNQHRMIHKHGCHYMCSICGFKENTHYFGQCTCEDFLFVKPFGSERLGQVDVMLIKSKLESLHVTKNSSEVEYLHFQIKDIPQIGILKNIKNLTFPSLSLYSIQFNVRVSNTHVFFTRGNGQQQSTETDYKLIVKRVSTESYMMIIEDRQEKDDIS